MINRKVILIAILLLSLVAVSAVSANEDIDNGLIKDADVSILQSNEISDSSIQSIEISDSNMESSDDVSDLELKDKDNALESADEYLELTDNDNISKSSDLELKDNDDLFKSSDEHILQMDENIWFYDYVVWYDGEYDDVEYVSIDFLDDLENPENITIKLSSDGSPIPGVDLALLNDQDFTITKLTTGDDGIAIYNIPFDVDQFSFCVGFLYGEDFVSNFAIVNDTIISSFNFDTWFKDPANKCFDFYVTVAKIGTEEYLNGAEVVLSNGSNHYYGLTNEYGIATLYNVAYGTYEVKVLYDGYRIFSLLGDDSIELYEDSYSGGHEIDDVVISAMQVYRGYRTVFLDLYYNDSNKVEDNTTYINGSGGSGGNFADAGTFTSLQGKINRAAVNSTLSLTNDYSYNNGFNIEGIKINKNLTIDGNGHTIDARGISRIFYVKNATALFKNIRFVNANASYGAAIYNGSALNCIFENNSASYGGAIYNGSALNCTFINNSASYGAAIYNCWFAVNSSFANNAVLSNDDLGDSASGNGSIVSFNPLTYYVPEPPRVSIVGSLNPGAYEVVHTPLYEDYNETFYLLTNCNLQEDTLNNYGTVELDGKDLVFRSLYPHSENYTISLRVSGKVFNPSYVLKENDTYDAHFHLSGLSEGIHEAHALINFGYKEGIRMGDYKMYTMMYDRNADIVFPISIMQTVEISSSNLIKYYGGAGRYTVTLTQDGVPLVNANINVFIAGKNYPLKTNANGQASMDINLAPGSYEAICSYGDDSASSNITVRSTINVQNVTGTYQNAKVNATFLNTAGNPLANTKVSFKVGSKTYSATTNANGVASANVDLNAGTYDVTAINPANNEQKISKLTISKAESTISLSSTSNNDLVTLTASLSPSTASGNVVFNLNNKNYTAKISSGKASQTISGLNEGNYTAIAYYLGDSNFNSSSASTDVVVKIVIPTKIIYNNMTTGPVAKSDGRIGNYFCVKLVDNNNNALTGLPIKIGFNGKIYDRTTDSNGEARLQINLANEDIYTFAICYLGDDDRQASFEVAKIDVNKKYPKPNKANGNSDGQAVENAISNTKLKTYIQYNNLTTKSVLKSDGRVGAYFEVKLLDNNRNAMANVPIKIGFNGKIYDRTTDSNGGAKLQVNLLKPTTYTFAIAYLGDSKYQASFEVAKIVVKAQSPKLTVPQKTFKANAKTKSVSATLISERGKPMSGQNLKFTINGKTYTGKTNSNGVATVKISLNKKGTYSCTVKFAGVVGANAKTTKTTIKIA